MQIIAKDFKKTRQFRSIEAVSLAFFLFFATGLSLAQQVSQKTFSSAENASQSLFAAVNSGNEVTIMQILSESKCLVSSGDDLEDKHDRQLFVRKYEEMHRLVEAPDGTTLLYIGAENWPFPVPLVSSNGAWHFDSQLGMEEVLFRRIGENETTAIQTSHALVQAEKQDETRLEGDDPSSRYASNFIREENGGPTTQNNPGPFYGYYFRILTRQGKNAPGGTKSDISDGKMTGGFAFVAYPADYRSSGVLTFIVDQNNVVYEKDLGPNTEKIAKEMTTYSPGRSWHAAE
jgi:hypothetical protein